MTKSLTDWLDTIRTSHSVIIDYSLNRIQTVAIHLDLLQPNAPVITVQRQYRAYHGGDFKGG